MQEYLKFLWLSVSVRFWLCFLLIFIGVVALFSPVLAGKLLATTGRGFSDIKGI